jgi:hypothetical protein
MLLVNEGSFPTILPLGGGSLADVPCKGLRIQGLSGDDPKAKISPTAIAEENPFVAEGAEVAGS